MASIAEIKARSKAKYFVSFFGKTTVDAASPEYQLARSIAAYVVEHDGCVIHGGYTGGMMEAVSVGAAEAIKRFCLPPERNIGVPHVEHDKTHGSRTRNSIFTEAAQDTFERLRWVSSSDICIVCPVGGEGTEMEQTYVFSENTFIRNPQPLIFVQTENGTQWDKIIDAKIQYLTHTENKRSDYPWLYIVRTFEECTQLIDRLSSEIKNRRP